MSATAREPQKEIVINGQAIPRGQRGVVRVPVVTDLDGSEIALYVHAVVGAKPGPVLALHTALHGSEWQAVEVTRKVIRGLDPAQMSGTVLAVPVGNPIALASRTRNLRDESDSPDLNRSFGGQETWLADQLARALVEHLLRHADALVDFHTGLWGSAMGSITCGKDFSDPGVSERSFQMARAFGLPHVHRGELATRFPGPKSAVGYAGQILGIPGVIVELGGVGFDPQLEEEWVETDVRGVRGIMQQLGILSGEPQIADRMLVFERVRRVNPTNGGMLEPVFPPEEMMKREVQPGELLGRVWSPYSFEVIEELRSPVRGLVDMASRPYPVRPGDWAYLVVDLDHPASRWLGRDDMP